MTELFQILGVLIILVTAIIEAGQQRSRKRRQRSITLAVIAAVVAAGATLWDRNSDQERKTKLTRLVSNNDDLVTKNATLQTKVDTLNKLITAPRVRLNTEAPLDTRNPLVVRSRRPVIASAGAPADRGRPTRKVNPLRTATGAELPCLDRHFVSVVRYPDTGANSDNSSSLNAIGMVAATAASSSANSARRASAYCLAKRDSGVASAARSAAMPAA